MIRTGTLRAARANRRHLILPNGTGYGRSELLTAPQDEIEAALAGRGWAPQCFLVEQDPGKTILSHFHQRDEFQVIVQGSGSFGRHPVSPVIVHYAGRHTGYGPIVAGEDGLWYFSLRAISDPGARFLPEARHEIDRNIPKRHALADPVPLEGDAPGVVDVFGPQKDNLGAWVVTAAPGTPLNPPAAPTAAARFYLILSGSVAHGGEALERFDAAFVAGEPFTPVAGPSGARVLAMQFPC